MRKGDALWAFALGCFATMLAIPATRGPVMELASRYPYPIGFAKFFVLATMGELLARRIAAGRWSAPPGLVFRSLVWGFLGMVITLVFELFSAGVTSAMSKDLLPGRGSTLAWAFLASVTMNLIFAPTMMLFHRIMDTFIDLKCEGRGHRVGLRGVIDTIDFHGFVSFTLLKTIPLFWIPAHTATFLLPPEYRVVAAAALSIALGAILAIGKRASPSLSSAGPGKGGGA
jgi:hypothetical protein